MMERKLYKTKLCVLYQRRGQCPRQTCSFAHGDTELRGSFNGRSNHRGGDLRDKIVRRRSPSPEERYSPGRDARGRHRYHGNSSSRSLEKKSSRKRRKKQLLDGQSDLSGSLKISDGTDDQVKDGKITSTGSKDVLEEQLKQVQSDINMMDHHKCQLELHLEERDQEVDSLTSKIQELETQLYGEGDECKRITSKIKKFLKAHNRHLQIRDELKRSQARLQKLGDQLGTETARLDDHEGDSNVNIVSDDDNTGKYLMRPQNTLETSAAPSKKRLLIDLNASVELTPEENLTNGGRYLAEPIRSKMPSRWNVSHAPSINENITGVTNNVNNGAKPLAIEAKRKGGRNVPTSSRSVSDKLKGFDSGFVLPSTSMAAHALDVVETVEEEKLEVVETASAVVEKGAVSEVTALPLPPPPPIRKNAGLSLPPPPPIRKNAGLPLPPPPPIRKNAGLPLPPPPPIRKNAGLPLPPPPPIRKNAYSQYKGDDENVDVGGLEEEMVDVDIV